MTQYRRGISNVLLTYMIKLVIIILFTVGVMSVLSQIMKDFFHFKTPEEVIAGVKDKSEKSEVGDIILATQDRRHHIYEARRNHSLEICHVGI